jgi:putative inorganic carbon (HCO3(-)) transporter
MRSEQAQRRDVLAFYALTAFAFVMYAVPGEWIPALAPLRLALVTSGLAAGLMVLGRVGRSEAFFLDGARGAALLLFSLLALASIWWAVNPDEARFAAVELLKLTAIYFALVNVVTSGSRLRVVAGAMILGSLVTSYGVIEWYFRGEHLVEGYRARWVGVFADPNRVAMNLGIVLPLTAAFIARRETGLLWRAVCLVSAAAAVVAIVFTYSRGGFIGMAVGMAVWALREQRRLRAVLVGSALALGLVLFAPKTFWERNETVTEFHQDASAMGRVYAWQVASRISIDRPMLGVGLGSFRFAWPLYAPPEARRAYVAHNVFLDVIGELGWVGLAFFLVFSGGASGGAFAASSSRQMGWLARGLAGSMAGYLVCQLSAGYLLSAHLYVLFGLAACAQRIAREEVEGSALTVRPTPAPAPVAAAAAAWGGTGNAT